MRRNEFARDVAPWRMRRHRRPHIVGPRPGRRGPRTPRGRPRKDGRRPRPLFPPLLARHVCTRTAPTDEPRYRHTTARSRPPSPCRAHTATYHHDSLANRLHKHWPPIKGQDPLSRERRSVTPAIVAIDVELPCLPKFSVAQPPSAPPLESLEAPHVVCSQSPTESLPERPSRSGRRPAPRAVPSGRFPAPNKHMNQPLANPSYFLATSPAKDGDKLAGIRSPAPPHRPKYHIVRSILYPGT